MSTFITNENGRLKATGYERDVPEILLVCFGLGLAPILSYLLINLVHKKKTIKKLPYISIGMTKSEVKIRWGEPIKIEKSITQRGTKETWWYKFNRKRTTVLFEIDGRVWLINQL